MNDSQIKIEEIIRVIRDKFEKRVAEIKAKGAKKLDDIQDDSPDPSKVEAVLNVTFDVKWKISSIKFDVPQFAMKTQSIKFDIPEVRMETETIKFDVPRTRMVVKCIVKNPVGRGCLTKTKVPEFYKDTVTIKTDIPKITSKTLDIKLDVPEIRMETTEIKLKLPQFYLRSLEGQINDQETDIQEVSNEMTGNISAAEAELKNSLQKEVSVELENLFNEMVEEIMDKREGICVQFDDAIAKIKSSIKILKENNATAEVQNLEAQLSTIVTDYTSVLSEIDKSIALVAKQKQQALSSIFLDETATIEEGIGLGAINPN